METFVTNQEIIFGYSNPHRAILTMDFKTLEPRIHAFATDEEKELVTFMAEDYPAGLVIKRADKQSVTLGPDRAFTHEVTLRGYGNPDPDQYADVAPKETHRVCSVEEACAAYLKYQQDYNLGMGNCGPDHGVVWELGAGRRKRAGRIKYGGRFEPKSGTVLA